MTTDKNGLTWDEWVKELFEAQDCDECGQGEENHTPALLNGLWFARCKSTPDTDPVEATVRAAIERVARVPVHKSSATGPVVTRMVARGEVVVSQDPDGRYYLSKPAKQEEEAA